LLLLLLVFRILGVLEFKQNLAESEKFSTWLISLSHNLLFLEDLALPGMGFGYMASKGSRIGPGGSAELALEMLFRAFFRFALTRGATSGWRVWLEI
jgi:cytochrome b561